MIRGSVEDPVLTLDNPEIARRHVTAFLFQKYHEARLPDIEPEEQPQLFAVLGTVGGFARDESLLNRRDFEAWLRENESELVNEIGDWLPIEISKPDREALLHQLANATLAVIDPAIEPARYGASAVEVLATDSDEED